MQTGGQTLTVATVSRFSEVTDASAGNGRYRQTNRRMTYIQVQSFLQQWVTSLLLNTNLEDLEQYLSPP